MGYEDKTKMDEDNGSRYAEGSSVLRSNSIHGNIDSESGEDLVLHRDVEREEHNFEASSTSGAHEGTLRVENRTMSVSRTNEDSHSERISIVIEEGGVNWLDNRNATTDTTTKKKTRKTIRYLTRVAALIILAIVVIGFFLVPVVFFVVETNTNSDTATATECTAEEYIGEVCQSILVDRQRCIPSRENTSEVYVLLTPSLQAIVEQQLLDILQTITPSPECEGQLLAFLCVEAFSGFCDSTGIVHRTTRQECEVVTSEVCAAEFEVIFPLLEGSGFDLSCDTFPETTNICNYAPTERVGTLIGSGTSSQPTDSGGSLFTTENRSCSDNFFLDETTNLCTPECGEWWPQSGKKRQLFTIVTLTAGTIGVSLSILVGFLSCLYYKTMFTFPGIFVFYQMLSSLLYGAVFLLTYVDFKNLMCESRNLIESLMPGNETPLCIISAASWIYVSHQVALWWIFHLSMVFCAVFWPFKYNYWKQLDYFKYIHTVMVAAGIILPIIPVIICLKVDGYVLFFLIRPDCVARNIQAAFYSHLLPLITTVVIGMYLLILIFWKFFSEEWKYSQRQHNTKRQVEIKILLLLCCYLVIWSDIIGVTVAALIEADNYRDTLKEYFTCEASGTLECERNSFERFDIVSKLIASALIGLYPAIFLIYFVKVKSCRLSCRSPATNSIGTNITDSG